jgi:hypothetical protein
MGRVVILHFEKKEDAELLVERVSRTGKVVVGVDVDNDIQPWIRAKADIIGMYMIPTQFCTCTVFRGPTYGTTYGLRICRGCKLPEKASWQMPKNLYDRVVDRGIKWCFSFVTGGHEIRGHR